MERAVIDCFERAQVDYNSRVEHSYERHFDVRESLKDSIQDLRKILAEKNYQELRKFPYNYDFFGESAIWENFMNAIEEAVSE